MGIKKFIKESLQMGETIEFMAEITIVNMLRESTKYPYKYRVIGNCFAITSLDNILICKFTNLFWTKGVVFKISKNYIQEYKIRKNDSYFLKDSIDFIFDEKLFFDGQVIERISLSSNFNAGERINNLIEQKNYKLKEILDIFEKRFKIVEKNRQKILETLDRPFEHYPIKSQCSFLSNNQMEIFN